MCMINRKAAREFALASARERYSVTSYCPTRVGASFFTRAEAALRKWIAKEIESRPSKGKTIQ